MRCFRFTCPTPAPLVSQSIVRGGGLEAFAGGGGGDDGCLSSGGSGAFGQEPHRRINLPPSHAAAADNLTPRSASAAGNSTRTHGLLPPFLAEPSLASLRAALEAPGAGASGAGYAHASDERGAALRLPVDTRLVEAVASARAAAAGKKLAITQTVKFAGQTMQVGVGGGGGDWQRWLG